MSSIIKSLLIGFPLWGFFQWLCLEIVGATVVKCCSLFISVDLVTLFLLIVVFNADGYFVLMRKTSVV